MKEKQRAFQIDDTDNVATALAHLAAGSLELLGDAKKRQLNAVEEIAAGHKIALRDIEAGEDIVKYGVSIGKATRRIGEGEWVHLHCMRSAYDERSIHLDVITGAPKDTKYE